MIKDRDQLIAIVQEHLDGYFAETEPGEEDTEDMAEGIVRAIETRGNL